MAIRFASAFRARPGAVLVDEVISRRDNNFDVLRLVAASLVLVSHAYALTGRLEPAVPFTDDTLGFDAVLIFFATSGLLITRSWQREPKASIYLVKRALRILPALAVSSLVTAVFLGAWVTTLPLMEYIRNPSTARYVVSNSLFRTDYSLAGVFGGNPMSTVNGSLGTLPTEVRAYILVLVVGMLIMTRRRLQQSALLLLGALVLYVSFTTGVKPPTTVVVLFATFGGGAVLALLRTKVPVRADFAVAAFAAWVASYHVPWVVHVVLVAIAVPYIATFLGARLLTVFRFVTRPGDVSYGVYVYAFPSEQAAVHSLGSNSVWVIMAVAGIPTYLLAWLSWRYVEHPCIRMVRFGHRLPGSFGRAFPLTRGVRDESSIAVPSAIP